MRTEKGPAQQAPLTKATATSWTAPSGYRPNSGETSVASRRRNTFGGSSADEDWGHFGGLNSDDERDSESEAANPRGEDPAPKMDDSTARKNMFASSRYGGCVCGVRYPVPGCGSVKNLSCAGAPQQEPTVVACEQQSASEKKAASEPGLTDFLQGVTTSPDPPSDDDDDDDPDIVGVSSSSSPRRARGVNNNASSSPNSSNSAPRRTCGGERDDDKDDADKDDADDLFSRSSREATPSPDPDELRRTKKTPKGKKGDHPNPESPTKVSSRRHASSDKAGSREGTPRRFSKTTDNQRGLPIDARVRKRRDDFCGDGRGGKTARWDVERWHVFAPRLLRPDGEYCPDRDGVVLSPAFAPRVATRYFARGDVGGLTVSLAMGSIRVVATQFDRYAQYELVVQIDGRPPTSTWRRYSAFRALVASVAAESAPRHIVRTLSAWADAQDAKKMFRCTHPAYLIQRYYHFEHVLREALFELPNPRLLLAFFQPSDDDPAPSAPFLTGPERPFSTPPVPVGPLGRRASADDDRAADADLDDDDDARASSGGGSRQRVSVVQHRTFRRQRRGGLVDTRGGGGDGGDGSLPRSRPRPRSRGSRHHSTPPSVAAPVAVPGSSADAVERRKTRSGSNRQVAIDASVQSDDDAGCAGGESRAVDVDVVASVQGTPVPANPILAALLGVRDVSRRPDMDPADLVGSPARSALRCY